ncbi:MAG: hypothetical protein U0V70_01630 [Terriglobia bacterium]
MNRWTHDKVFVEESQGFKVGGRSAAYRENGEAAEGGGRAGIRDQGGDL